MTATIIVLVAVLFIGLGWKIEGAAFRRGMRFGYREGYRTGWRFCERRVLKKVQVSR